VLSYQKKISQKFQGFEKLLLVGGTQHFGAAKNPLGYSSYQKVSITFAITGAPKQSEAAL
jgi:hypothetical protein